MVIIFMFLVLCIILTALISCINTDIGKYKWLWVIFIMFGLFGVDFNWAIQEFDYSLLSFRLFGVGWFKASCYSALVLNLSVPIGAISFLVTKYGFKKFS